MRFAPLESFRSLRVLRRQKRFVALAVLSLGVAIALTTTMYGVLDAIINPYIAIDTPEQLVAIRYFGSRERPIPPWDLNDAILHGLTFHEGAAGSLPEWDNVVERGRDVRAARILSVTPNYFKVLGVHAVRGRLFDERDLEDDIPPVVVGEPLWRELFPERPTFTPAPIRVNGDVRMIVGLLPQDATFPGDLFGVWQIATPRQLGAIPLSLLRLKPGVTLGQAEEQLRTLGTRLRQRGASESAEGFQVFSATHAPFRVFQFHWALIGAVLAVLIIACANLANLQLARGLSRARELATRAAMGASQRDLIAQLVLETSWLAFGGLLLAALLTWWGARLMNALIPPEIADYVTHAQLSWRVAIVGVVTTLMCLVAVGLLPAIRIARVDINHVLKSGAGTGATRRTRTQYGALVVLEVALAVAVLTTTSLLTKASAQLHSFTIEPAQRELVVGMVLVDRPTPNDRTQRREWSNRVIHQAMSMDSVIGAATHVIIEPMHRAVTVYGSNGVPMSHFVPLWGYRVVSPDFLRVRDIRVLRGRDFSPGEFATPEVIVDREAASFLWPGRDPVGQQIKLDSVAGNSPWLRVVGVADNEHARRFDTDQDAVDAGAMRRAGVSSAFDGTVYVLNAADTGAIGAREIVGRQRELLRLTVRTRDDALRTTLLLPRVLRGLGNNVRVFGAQTWEQSTGVPELRARHDFMATLFAVFAVVAMALAAIGVFAIVAQSVAQRTREFGVRVAIGATQRDIRELVIREGNLLSLGGIAIGLLLTVYSARLVRAFVFSDYDRYDSRWFAGAALLIYAVAWLASYLPARRAMRINPVEALRND